MTESVGMCAHEREWERAKQSTHTQNATQAHTPKTQNLTVLALNLYWICNSPFFFLSISTPFSDRVRWTLHFPIILGKLFSLALHDSSLDLIYQYFFLGQLKTKYICLCCWIYESFVGLCDCEWVRLELEDAAKKMSTQQRQHVNVRDLAEEAKKRIVVLIICVVGLSYLMSCMLFFLFSFLISIILVIYVFVFYLFIYWFYMFLSSIIVTCLCLFSENLDWFVVLIVIGYLGSCCF